MDPHNLRWALIEAAHTAARRSLVYRAGFEATRRRLGPQRGSQVAAVELARKLAEAIWHMLTRQQPFIPWAGATCALTA